MDKVFDLNNIEHRKYLMKNADSIRKRELNFYSYIHLNTTESVSREYMFNLYNDKIIKKYCYDFTIYFDDNTIAEYHIKYVGHLSKFSSERFQSKEETPYDGVFAIKNSQIFSSKQSAEKMLFYDFEYNRHVPDYDTIDLMCCFAHHTESIKTFCKRLNGQGINITDNDIKGRVETNYLPREKKYSVKITASAGIDEQLNEILKEFNINKENSEILTETMQIQVQ